MATATARAQLDNGATQRLQEVLRLLEESGFRVQVVGKEDVMAHHRPVDLAVAVSYACAGAVRRLAGLADRVWLDAVDSWLLVNASGLRAGSLSYAARACRDGGRLLLMPRAHLVTYISRADMQDDRRTVRGEQRLVLPAAPSSSVVRALPQDGRRRAVLAGDWTYPPNRTGLGWFCARVLPLLEQRLPDGSWQLAVFGRGADGVLDVRSGALRGHVRDEAELYRSGDVHVAPVCFGGGVKRKVLQPLLVGLPVVTTKAGAHGLRAHALLDVRDDAADMAEAVARRLLHDTGEAPAPCRAPLDADDTDAVRRWLLETGSALSPRRRRRT